MSAKSLKERVDRSADALKDLEPNWDHLIPTSEPYRKGMEQFNLANYGLAEGYFREAVEKKPQDVRAWVFLAASYDHLGRFDLADKAYLEAIAISGETVEILNNQGYSLMLRGNFEGARQKFQKALKLDPSNQTLINNQKILSKTRAGV